MILSFLFLKTTGGDFKPSGHVVSLEPQVFDSNVLTQAERFYTVKFILRDPQSNNSVPRKTSGVKERTEVGTTQG